LPKRDLQPLQIYRLLPRTNCKLCGCPTCYAFAFNLISRDKRVEDCPELLKPESADSYARLKELIGEGERVEGTDHVVDRSRCTGCGDCVAVCTRALTTVTSGGRLIQRDPVPPVLQVVDGSIAVIHWPGCKRAVPGMDICNLCADKCPFSAIDLVKSEKEDQDEEG